MAFRRLFFFSSDRDMTEGCWSCYKSSVAVVDGPHHPKRFPLTSLLQFHPSPGADDA